MNGPKDTRADASIRLACKLQDPWSATRGLISINRIGENTLDGVFPGVTCRVIRLEQRQLNWSVRQDAGDASIARNM